MIVFSLISMGKLPKRIKGEITVKKKIKKPFREDYNMSRITIDNAASNTECTGLMPTPADSSEERDSYAAISNFFPEDIAFKPEGE